MFSIMFFLMMVLWAQLWSPCKSRTSSFSSPLGWITKPSADGFRHFRVTRTFGMFWYQRSYFCNLSLILFWIYQECFKEISREVKVTLRALWRLVYRIYSLYSRKEYSKQSLLSSELESVVIQGKFFNKETCNIFFT